MKNIIVYGAGGNYIDFSGWLNEHYHIVALVDGDVEKIGHKIEGVLVQAVSILKHKEFDLVVITPNNFEPILKFLKESGIEESKICTLEEVVLPKQDTYSIHVCFSLIGGLGDSIIAYNYIYHFCKKFGTDRCQIYIANSSKAFREFAYASDFVHQFIAGTYDKDEYDLVIELSRYPRVVMADYLKIAATSRALLDYVFICKKFEFLHPKFLHFLPKYDGESREYEQARNRTRFLQPDIDGELEITEEYAAPVLVDRSILESFFLYPGSYITIHRGCDRNFYASSSVKLWDEECYEQLICMLKKEYPQYKIVLLGDEYERSKKIKSADVDLLGRTSIQQLKAILKYAKLHIDTEGGLVHLRHAVRGGISVVLFGPTSAQFFGYTENINVRTDYCPEPCEWKSMDWAVRCSNLEKPHICMRSITADMIVKQIREKALL